jgi:hypothetical protein
MNYIIIIIIIIFFMIIMNSEELDVVPVPLILTVQLFIFSPPSYLLRVS